MIVLSGWWYGKQPSSPQAHLGGVSSLQTWALSSAGPEFGLGLVLTYCVTLVFSFAKW